MYYQLESNEPEMTAYITPDNECSDSLIGGRFIDPTGEELPFRYHYHDPTGSPLFDYYSGKSLMSKRLVAALEGIGVENLQKFDTELVDQNTGKVSTDFWIVNIIGLVSCADLAGSKTSEIGASYYFHDLVIDPAKTEGRLVFRLAESMGDVLVHEKVAKEIEAGAFRGIVLNPLKTAL